MAHAAVALTLPRRAASRAGGVGDLDNAITASARIAGNGSAIAITDAPTPLPRPIPAVGSHHLVALGKRRE